MSYGRVVRAFHERSGAFSNYRDWRAFLAAVQAPAAYASVAAASVATALKAGHEWLTGRGSSLADPGLVSPGLVPPQTLGV
jgi:hypothetical protein